eukprot:scaffold70157_cov55-Phaeocystis_antarctica.AAC.7
MSVSEVDLNYSAARLLFECGGGGGGNRARTQCQLGTLPRAALGQRATGRVRSCCAKRRRAPRAGRGPGRPTGEGVTHDGRGLTDTTGSGKDPDGGA